MPRPPLPPTIGTPPMPLATGCAVSGCEETGVPRSPTEVTAGLTDGATPPQPGGTDSRPDHFRLAQSSDCSAGDSGRKAGR